MTRWFVLLPAALLSLTSRAAPAVFDFADPKGVNAIQVLLDTPLEPIAGLADGIGGTVTFDPAAPERSTGRIEVEAGRIQFANPQMAAFARTADWLDVEQFPAMSFAIRSVANVKPVAGRPNEWTGDLVGELTIRGVTRPLTVPVRVHYMPGKLGDRVPGMIGDLLAVRAQFALRRTEFGLKQDPDFLHVADEVQIALAIVGQSTRQAKE